MVSMDQKCIGCCWYCTDLCAACMVRSAVPGLSSLEDIDSNSMVLKHCSKECLEKFSRDSLGLPAKIVQPTLLLHEGEAPYCIFKVSKMVQTTGNTLTHVTVRLCLDGLNGPNTKIIALVHMRTRIAQHFIEFEMNQHMELGQVLEYLQAASGPADVIAQVKGTNIVTEILSSAFEELGNLNLRSLLAQSNV